MLDNIGPIISSISTSQLNLLNAGAGFTLINGKGEDTVDMTNAFHPILTTNGTRYIVHRFSSGPLNRHRNLRFNGLKYVPFYRHTS